MNWRLRFVVQALVVSALLIAIPWLIVLPTWYPAFRSGVILGEVLCLAAFLWAFSKGENDAIRKGKI